MVAQIERDALIEALKKCCRGLIGFAACLFFATFVLIIQISETLAQSDAKITASRENGFGRIVFSFQNLPGFKIRVTTGVLVVSFDEPVQVDPGKVAVNLSNYVGAARIDPDRRAVRFALTQSLTVNSMEAGDQLFVDLMPAGWQGLPPGLPEEVIAQLARRAELAESKARREALEAAARENAATIEVQAGQYQTFSRISFEWNQPFEAKLARDGNKVFITFNKLASINLDDLTISMPQFLNSISSRLTDRGLELELELIKGAAIRAFKDGRSYIVDLSTDGGGFAGQNSSQHFGEDASQIVLPGQEAAESEYPVWRRRTQSTITSSFIPLDPRQRVPADYGDWINQIADISQAGGATVRVQSGLATSQDGQTSQGVAILAEGVDIPTENVTSVAVTSKRNAHSITVTFGFPEKVRAAIFRRGNTIWSVFDSDVPIDVGALEQDLSDRLEYVRVTRSGAMQYVKMRLKGPALTSVSSFNRLWTITVGDMVADPTIPLMMERKLGDDGLPRVVVELVDAGPVHWIEDKELGDRVAVVTAFGPARGMIKQQQFVEFTLYPSAHGLALSPIADDLRVLSQVDQVIIGRRQGLWLSAANGLSETSARDGLGAPRPAFIDFARFLEGGIGAFLPNRQKYELAVTVEEEADRTKARLELVRFYLAHLLASEASAVLKLAGQDDPSMIKGPTFQALSGVAQTLMGHLDDAESHFSQPGLAQGREIMLWRSLIEAEKGNWQVAKMSIEKGEDLLWDYPDELRARFIATAARAALEINDLGAANHYLAVLEDIDSNKNVQAETILLRGRYLVGIGQSSAGLAMYEAAIDTQVRPVETEARFLKLVLAQEKETIEQDQLILSLENLSMSWRGGEFELKTLHQLAGLYSEQNRFRDLFEVMKIASRLSFDSELTRDIQDKITVSFQNLFLGDRANSLSPIEALSLFYDHRALTPVGRKGDELIRRLADRLVDVDLLDQAAELLTHQVDNRLTGAARAQVAAQLALVHLMNRNPIEAVKVLNRTQFVGIPHKVQRHRNILKARALADAGRMELAVDILETMIGDDIETQKADVLWQARAWQDAAEQYELILGDNWKNTDVMSEEERRNAMRSAISYSLANDQLGLDRLRSKYLPKMSEGPDAKAFQVVTNPVADQGLEFRELARSIASVDTLESFLREFRERQSELNGNGSSEPQG